MGLMIFVVLSSSIVGIAQPANITKPKYTEQELNVLRQARRDAIRMQQQWDLIDDIKDYPITNIIVSNGIATVEFGNKYTQLSLFNNPCVIVWKHEPLSIRYNDLEELSKLFISGKRPLNNKTLELPQ